MEYHKELLSFHVGHGHVNIPDETNPLLQRWAMKQSRHFMNGLLSEIPRVVATRPSTHRLHQHQHFRRNHSQYDLLLEQRGDGQQRGGVLVLARQSEEEKEQTGIYFKGCSKAPTFICFTAPKACSKAPPPTSPQSSLYRPQFR